MTQHSANTPLPSVAKVRLALNHILQSERFSASKRNQQLLTYLVEEVLAGRGHYLKGYRIAIDVFGRDTDFDAQNNPLVRNQMVRLRLALEQYYLLEKKLSEVVFHLDKGAYAPRINTPETITKEEASAAKKASANTTKPLLIVYPFDVSQDISQRHFSEGLTQDLTNALAQFGHIDIVTFDTNYSSELTANRACYLLKGYCHKSINQLRINLELIERNTAICLWAEKFQCDLTVEDIFDLQDRITRDVASKIADYYGVIPRRLTENMHQSPPSSVSAYEAVLSFYHYELDLKQAQLPTVISGLERALKEEPNYALGWAALAEAYADLFVYDFCRDQDLLIKSKQYSDSAITLDPACQHAYWSRALAYHLSASEQDLLVSHAAIEKLLTINANAASFVCGSGLLLALQGDWGRGLDLIQEFDSYSRYNPRWICFARQIFYYLEGEYLESLISIQEQKTAMAPWDLMLSGLCCWQLNRPTEAATSFNELRQIWPSVAESAAELKVYVRAFVKETQACNKLIDDLSSALECFGKK